MQKYHTGYFITSEKLTPEKYSEIFILKKKFKLIPQNYNGKDYQIIWKYVNGDFGRMSGLEFVIMAESFEIAQNILFLVLCAETVICGTTTSSNIAHYPYDYKINLNDFKIMDSLDLPNLIAQMQPNVFKYFYLAAIASKNNKISNAIIKYQLSTQIYSQHDMDLHEIDWKKTEYGYMQMRMAYAIIVAYSVIEELGLEIRASQKKPSVNINGQWNQEVLEDLLARLKKSNINIKRDVLWMNRGDETEIEKTRPIKIKKLANYSGPSEYDKYFIEIKDAEVYIPEAIHYISYLRSKIASHSVEKKIFQLSVFDVANAQHLARRLLLESIHFWNKNLTF